MRVAYFGLPLGALLLLTDGVDLRLAALSPVPAPGRRRLRRLLGSRVVEAGSAGTHTARDFEAHVDRIFDRDPPDLVVSWFFTRRIPSRWIRRPRVGIGAHPSLLPRHRGPDPFFWAIDQGDSVTGVTIHLLEEGYDEGGILLQEPLEIGNRNAWELARALDRVGLRAIRRVTRRFVQGDPPEVTPQDSSRATWAGRPAGEQLTAHYDGSTERVLRRIRALSPVPGLALEVRGCRFFVTRASAAEEFPVSLLPGEASIGVDGVVIRTGDGAVRLDRAVLGYGPEADREIDGRALAERLQQVAH